MRTKTILAGLTVALLAVPFVSSAATINDLQAQLMSLLSQIQSLQIQGAATSSISVGPNSSLTGTVVSSCPSFVRSLSIGSSGSDVTALQQFLSAQGLLNVSATGYFGALTKAALGKWQSQNDITVSGNAGFGIFGPLSRAFFSRNCSGSGTSAAPTFSATPASGLAPLSVQFVATAPQGTTLGSSVTFGDGMTGTLLVVPTCSSCNEEATVTHTYTSAGTYNATLTSGACACPANGICNCPNMMILGTATVSVSSTSPSTSGIQQLNSPGSVTLQTNGIAEIRNQSFYFTLESLTSSSATIQITPVGCWNSFPSDTPPQIRCMIALVPIPPQTLTLGQSYTSSNYGITLTQINNANATFSVNATAAQY